MKITLNENSKITLKRGAMAIMKSSGITRVILVEDIKGDTFTGTTLYFNSDLPGGSSGTTFVGDYSSGWQTDLFTPLAGALEMVV